GGKKSESTGLVAQLLPAIYPEIAGIAVFQVLARLQQERRDRAELLSQILLCGRRQGEMVGIELDFGIDVRRLAQRHVRAGRPYAHIKGRIASPRAQDP